ncbi:MAG: hypothetical protein ABSG13_26035 [Bryobacteraceae bacterium]|jgi:hypothetical protein
MKNFCHICCIAMATVSILAAADAPFMGKWKLNLAKSRLTGETLSIEQTSSGGMKYVTAEISYDFKPEKSTPRLAEPPRLGRKKVPIPGRSRIGRMDSWP